MQELALMSDILENISLLSLSFGKQDTAIMREIERKYKVMIDEIATCKTSFCYEEMESSRGHSVIGNRK